MLPLSIYYEIKLFVGLLLIYFCKKSCCIKIIIVYNTGIHYNIIVRGTEGTILDLHDIVQIYIVMQT